MSDSTNAERERPVLVPVNFSPACLAALEFGAHLARQLDAPLAVLHTLSDGERRASVTPKLEAFIARAGPASGAGHNDQEAPPKLRTILVEGAPAERIPEVAERETAVMVVLGSPGEPGSRLPCGLIADQIGLRCQRPVTLVTEPSATWRRTDQEPVRLRRS